MTEPHLAEALRVLDEIEAQVRVVRELVTLATQRIAQLMGEEDADA